MKTVFSDRRLWTAFVAAGLLTALVAGADKGREIRYCLWDLGTLGGDTIALAINSDGHHVVGSSDITKPPATHAFRWTEGVMTDLGTLGGTWAEARSVNFAGEVVGVSTNARGEARAFYAARNTMVDLNELLPILPDPPGGEVECEAPLRVLFEANAISDTGVIAACGEVWADDSPHAFLLVPTATGTYACTDLGRLPGAEDCFALGVGPRRQVVGQSGGQPFIWKQGQIRPLETSFGESIPPGQANAMNRDGVVVGSSGGEGVAGPHATLWQNGQRIPLSRGMAMTSSANDINAQGHVVGWEMTWDSVPRAMVWNGEEAIDLNDVTAIPIAPHAFMWSRLLEATGVDDHNQIVGNGTSLNGQMRAFLLTPFAPDWPTR